MTTQYVVTVCIIIIFQLWKGKENLHSYLPTNSQIIIFNFGRSILNTHDNIVNADDNITVLINAYVSMNDTDFTNQVIYT